MMNMFEIHNLFLNTANHYNIISFYNIYEAKVVREFMDNFSANRPPSVAANSASTKTPPPPRTGRVQRQNLNGIAQKKKAQLRTALKAKSWTYPLGMV